ncbi:Dabb family protein [Adhaeretor mobilis]|uniref:Stress responsive A/B Barrel Domain protein n=1 Tax=Adhaeretor mobilis TaxID=1930276 RepID=A0A517MSE9_9BACT|nr:Dabb family protein [Adhaeretor mobilis]QDS97798.1 Stress responsive A/B Barrel Domain protein [Adhaeretor mobilis]
MKNSDSLPLVHSVYFTLKDSSAESCEKFRAACRKYLAGHPGSVHFSAGYLADQYDRPVNDREFHVAVVGVFENAAAHDAYQVSDRHNQFLAEQAENWSQVRVFDAVG